MGRLSLATASDFPTQKQKKTSEAGVEKAF
jgi:hypothetical protein